MQDGAKSATQAAPPRTVAAHLDNNPFHSQLGRYLLALLIGAAGSVVFVYAHLPLPWFLGALSFCLVASVLKAPILRPVPLTIPMRAVLGVAVGTAFTPALLGQVGGMAGSLAILVPFMVLIIAVSLVFY